MKIDFKHARGVFEDYLNGYDREDEKIKLKIIHTYGVVKSAREIGHRMHLNEEDQQLAELIALLHDIGRFQQLRLYNSFSPDTMDHAAFGVQLLFEGENPMISRFIEDRSYDELIRVAIARHSDFHLEGITDNRTLLHARLIRDADKLDNCRVKLQDDLLVFMGASGKEIGAQEITPVVYDTVLKDQCIYSPDRVTKMDYWVSYVAYFCDIYFRASFDIIEEHDYLNKIIDRIPYSKWKTFAHISQNISMMHQESDTITTLFRLIPCRIFSKKPGMHKGDRQVPFA